MKPFGTVSAQVKPVPPQKPAILQTKKSKPSASGAEGASYINVGLSEDDVKPVVNVDPHRSTKNRAASAVSQQSIAQEAEEEVEEAEVEPEVERSYSQAVHERIYYNDEVYMTSEGASLRLDSVQQYLLDKLRGDDFDEEFQVL